MLTVLYTLTMHRNLLMIKFYRIWSRLKDILIKSHYHFLCCASAAVCLQTARAATEIPGLLEVNKTVFGMTSPHIVAILTAKPRWRFILLNKINFSTHELTG